jgi:hypothetical protein
MDKTHILVALSDLVFLPDSKEYKASSNSYFTAFENEINPLCVAQPRNVKELSELLKRVSDIPNLSVAVRGGGHTPWAGAANAEGGITVDLLHFKGIEVDIKAGLVHIGARETWGDVYGKLAEHGLSVSGGRVSRVAVSGLTLGGMSKFILSMLLQCSNISFQVDYPITLGRRVLYATVSKTSKSFLHLEKLSKPTPTTIPTSSLHLKAAQTISGL